ncbi:MAG: branched-chain amino acid transport system substrate-binding protein [Azoarcus sp.]|nr:branched-chain amino acid transport system substrate-binding protein [Azoarcus sp.]
MQDYSIARRRFLIQSAAVGAGAWLQAPVFAQGSRPLKVGFLNSFSKAFAALGQGNLNGFNLYLDSQGGEFAGRKIVVVQEDDEINPQVALQKLKRLVEGENCEVIVGMQASNVAMAAVDYLRRSQRLTLCSGAGTTALSYINVPNFFRVSTSTYQSNFAMGGWLRDNVAPEAVIIASDFAGGRDSLKEFKLGYQKAGGKVLKEIYAPLGTTDYSVYLADIKAINPPVVYAFFAGSDALRFVKQFEEQGLKGRIKLASSGFMVESDVLPAQGRAALAILNAQHYADTLDNPENRKFVADYHAKFNEFPSVYAEYGYVAARVLHDALKATGGDTSKVEALSAAVLKTRFNAPRGPVSIDPTTHSVVHNVYLREVAEVDGRITNKVLSTIAQDLRDPPKAE